MSDDHNSCRGDAGFDRSADLALTTTPDEIFPDEYTFADRSSRSVESTTPVRPTLMNGETVEVAR